MVITVNGVSILLVLVANTCRFTVELLIMFNQIVPLCQFNIKDPEV